MLSLNSALLGIKSDERQCEGCWWWRSSSEVFLWRKKIDTLYLLVEPVVCLQWDRAGLFSESRPVATNMQRETAASHSGVLRLLPWFFPRPPFCFSRERAERSWLGRFMTESPSYADATAAATRTVSWVGMGIVWVFSDTGAKPVLLKRYRCLNR